MVQIDMYPCKQYYHLLWPFSCYRVKLYLNPYKLFQDCIFFIIPSLLFSDIIMTLTQNSCLCRCEFNCDRQQMEQMWSDWWLIFVSMKKAFGKSFPPCC